MHRFWLLCFLGVGMLVFVGCEKEKSKSLPSVVLVSISEITSRSAKIVTQVTNEGSSNVTGTGACWSEQSYPDLSDNSSNVGAGTGQFITLTTSLEPNTTYYLRAYARSEVGTAYSESGKFKTLP